MSEHKESDESKPSSFVIVGDDEEEEDNDPMHGKRELSPSVTGAGLEEESKKAKHETGDVHNEGGSRRKKEVSPIVIQPQHPTEGGKDNVSPHETFSDQPHVPPSEPKMKESKKSEDVKEHEGPKKPEESKKIEESKKAEEPKKVEDSKKPEEPKNAEEPKTIEESKMPEEPKNSDSSVVPPKVHESGTKENKAPDVPHGQKIVVGLPPNQDPVVDEEVFEVKYYAPLTDKDEEVNGEVVSPKSDSLVHTSPPPSTESKKTEFPDDERSECLSEEVTKNLDANERKVVEDTEPVIEGFLAGYHQILEREQEDAAASHLATAPKKKTFDASFQTKARTPSPCIPLFHQERTPLSAAGQVGHQLSEVAVQFDAQYRPVVRNLVQEFFAHLRRENNGDQPKVETIWENVKKIVQEIFRDGFTWSRILILLMFVFEVFVWLYEKYVPQTAKSFIHWFLKYMINFGVTRWIAQHGGWSMSIVGVRQEQSVAGAAGLSSCNYNPVIVAAVAFAFLSAAVFWFTKRSQ